MTNRILFVIVFSIVSHLSFSQPALAWSLRYNGPPSQGDEAVSIAVDATGNSYVTGSAFAANGTLDIVTIKYSPSGQQLWLQSYNGTANGNDQGTKIVLDNAGNVYVTGYTNNNITNGDITTIKYNASGIQQWVSFYNGSFNNYDQGNALSVDANGNVYVIGYETTSNYTYDFVTLKYNSAGVQQWAQTYDGPGNFNDEGRDIGLDVNGNVYVTGPSDTFYNAQPNEDIVLLKYNNSGVLQWRKVYDGPGHSYEWSKKLTIDKNNDILVVGYGWTASGNGNDYIILKWNPSGNFQWIRTYNFGTNTFENPADIITDSLNNVIVTGQGITNASTDVTNDYVTVKYNSAGTFQWVSRYNGITHGDDRATSVALDDSLCIYVTGFSQATTGPSTFDIITVKYDPAGNEMYTLRFNNASANKDDAGNSIAIKNGDIYITGKSANLTNDDYITLRYSYSAVGINEQQNGINSFGVFPNPSTSELHLSVSTAEISSTSPFTATITNSLGQVVKKCNAVMTESVGSQSILSVDVSEFEMGIYLITVLNDEKIIGSSKFVVK
ncbi:MAG: SBBP repeat-containing protein [Bacteroidetes bacterium]|nr:SBBP repeat-containing protein [Bacteroidota bacterium]